MRYLFVGIALLALSGCMSMGTKVDQDQLSQFVKGRTTYAEVVQQLGEPTQNTINSDGTRTITYFYSQSQARAVDFIPVVGAFLGGSTSKDTTVTLNFDRRSLLTNYTATQGGMNVGTGIASGQRQ
ncbi:MAG: outer membrane protein assembly factor BamE domain-containing protein [Acidobacteriaceae bacterium]